MNKTASPIGSTDFFNQEYIPTQYFMEYLNKADNLPYSSEMSFEPFLNKLQSMSTSNCKMTQDALSPMFHSAESLLNKTSEDIESMSDELLQKTLASMFPYMFLNEQKSFIGSPFKKKSIFQTPATRHLFDSGEWLIRMDLIAHKENMITSTIRAGAFLLEKFYNVELDNFHSQTITFKNIKTGLEKHFKIEVKNDFVEAIAIKPLKKLSKKKISYLLNNIYDELIWLKCFPFEDFKFKGFLIGTFYDVTGLETMSILKNKVTLTEEEVNPEFFFPFVEQQLKNFLSLPDLRVGMLMITYEQFYKDQSFSLCKIDDLNVLKRTGSEGIYAKSFKSKTSIIYDDISQYEYDPIVKEALSKNKIKSLILYPIYDSSGKLSSVLEIGSSKPMRYNALTLLRLKDFFELMVLGSERYLRTMDNMIGLFIQEQFTSVHKSVEWRFQEVATKYEINKSLSDFDGVIEPIVFKDIYPLYGQADIVGSSNLRNESIQIDLTDNLLQALHLMKSWNQVLPFHLVESYVIKVENILSRIENEFTSSDESLIVELLTSEIHPLANQLFQKHPELPTEVYHNYLRQLDPNLNIVYKQRKAYEQSVSQINSAISNFLEKDDQKMQKVLPHYFEKYKTDGVEYNIYLGESILKDGGFSLFFLKNFRIWQLVNACEITRLVEKLSTKLPMPLKTAQLLFVYNNSLSIRFRMDEKQFDVDGSYNIRYEILKKRIDKAVIKGTDERLTVAGKVAIVYLQEKDRLEYLEYFDFLIQKGYIKPEIENLELEKLQGAEGLKALRVTVI